MTKAKSRSLREFCVALSSQFCNSVFLRHHCLLVKALFEPVTVVTATPGGRLSPWEATTTCVRLALSSAQPLTTLRAFYVRAGLKGFHSQSTDKQDFDPRLEIASDLLEAARSNIRVSSVFFSL